MKKRKTIAVAVALAGIITIGGIMAYFTDTESKENIFVIGSGIDINLEEEFPDTPPIIDPNGKQTKNPKVAVDVNSEDCYAFIEYTLPTEKIDIYDTDGKTILPGKTSDTYNELFTTNKVDGSAGVNGYTADTDGWVLVDSYPTEYTDDTTGTGTRTYVYGYVDKNGNLKVLQPGSETISIFNSVTFANVIKMPKSVSTIGTTDNALSIPVKAYAIQTKNVVEEVSPASVWAILKDAIAA